MSQSSSLILLGVLVFLSPFLGLPSSWLAFLLPIFGIIVAAIGLSMRFEHVRAERAKHETLPMD